MRSDHVKLALILAGLVALILIGHRFTRSARFEQTVKSGKEKIAQQEVSRQVICDACDAVSPKSVSRKNQSEYQKCPACGEVAARAIIYYVCNGRECNRQLVKTPAGVIINNRISFRPGSNATCPVCGNPQNLDPRTIEYAEAEKIAEETGQEFP